MARQRIKVCNRCSLPAPILYRVKYQEDSVWIFVCNECLPAVKNNPFYFYGGTWKAQKK